MQMFGKVKYMPILKYWVFPNEIQISRLLKTCRKLSLCACLVTLNWIVTVTSGCHDYHSCLHTQPFKLICIFCLVYACIWLCDIYVHLSSIIQLSMEKGCCFISLNCLRAKTGIRMALPRRPMTGISGWVIKTFIPTIMPISRLLRGTFHQII